MKKIAVIFACVCKNCESLVGGEKVGKLTAKEVEENLKNDPENFFKYPDAQKRSEYRSVSYTHRCVQC